MYRNTSICSSIVVNMVKLVLNLEFDQIRCLEHKPVKYMLVLQALELCLNIYRILTTMLELWNLHCIMEPELVR